MCDAANNNQAESLSSPLLSPRRKSLPMPRKTTHITRPSATVPQKQARHPSPKIPMYQLEQLERDTNATRRGCWLVATNNSPGRRGPHQSSCSRASACARPEGRTLSCSMFHTPGTAHPCERKKTRRPPALSCCLPTHQP